MTSVDIFNHLGWKGPFTPDYVYRVFLALQLCTDGTVLTTLMKKGTRVNARSRKPRLIHKASQNEKWSRQSRPAQIHRKRQMTWK